MRLVVVDVTSQESFSVCASLYAGAYWLLPVQLLCSASLAWLIGWRVGTIKMLAAIASVSTSDGV